MLVDVLSVAFVELVNVVFVFRLGLRINIEPGCGLRFFFFLPVFVSRRVNVRLIWIEFALVWGMGWVDLMETP